MDCLQDQKAVVIFSGGQDSSTCLAWALHHFKDVLTIGFDYGQRHSTELKCRVRVRDGMAALKKNWAEKLGADFLLNLDTYRHRLPTALTSDIPIEENGEGYVPNTFVPGRNLLFILLTAIWAYAHPLRHVVMGVCESDYSGYPDCRDDSIKAMQTALNLGMNTRYVLHTPLMWRKKADVWKLAWQLGGDALVNLIVEESHTCYLGDRSQRHTWGYGCGVCPACRLRARGYDEYCQSKQSVQLTCS
ncbi:MAG: 7-cyano-7-deazaguanine synthase QueC [Desulfovibrio sp.]|nr:7-cyano-7-deazaguanine synthase QueC [Desulfovibrio sp.]